jgi:hypothetical protein
MHRRVIDEVAEASAREPIALFPCCSYTLEVSREVEQFGSMTVAISMMSFSAQHKRHMPFSAQPANLKDIYAGDEESRKLDGVASSEL